MTRPARKSRQQEKDQAAGRLYHFAVVFARAGGPLQVLDAAAKLRRAALAYAKSLTTRAEKRSGK
jgi:hypothetical protein